MKNAKVQTNDYGVNVLVETNESNNRHCSNLNVDVNVEKVLTDEEIIEVWRNRDSGDELKLAKNWIMKQKGYAISSCVDGIRGIKHNSIVKYE